MTRLRLLLPASTILATALALPVEAQGFFPQWEISLQRLMSGMKVSGAQSSTTALQTTNGHKAAAEAVASTLVSQDNALRLAQAQHQYGYDTGTGYAACNIALGISQERDSYASATKVRQAFRQADQRWLTGGGNAAERMGATLDQRRTFYCSPSEQDTGWCTGAKPGGYGAGDSDAAPWLFNRDYGAEEVMTAADYLDVVAPLPTVKPNPATAEEDAALVQARRQGAILSGARASLVGVLVGGMGGDSRQGGTP
ncbi:hypothetical protein MKK50_08815 [Methylobacterium sp. J-043]|uniref:hypothetical protein n=1 Tax=Methylorubrum TaxID=2282523 RepID=UPI00209E44BC|nr:hypothetical protein [Methylobacterium sp. J-043]MCP1551461.1 hypothetical protein [Methylorubrum zatmanii]MCP1556398.1 hypothetical protein [Methylorubrum extorquens]MCP1581941.1 hypothetical protein [Methylorubrum extorquens]